jgi:4-hydroxy-tetrahydrodipicolinate reductase
MIRITLAGCTGWVGKALVVAIAAAPDLELVAGISRKAAGRDLGEATGQPTNGLPVFSTMAEALVVPSDVVIDYTKPDSVKANVLTASLAAAMSWSAPRV